MNCCKVLFAIIDKFDLKQLEYLEMLGQEYVINERKGSFIIIFS